jgi:hypothetical protein
LRKDGRINENLEVLKEEQIQGLVTEVIAKKSEWRMKNPGKDFPASILEEEAAANLGLSIEDYREYKLKKLPREEVSRMIAVMLQSGEIKNVSELSTYSQRVWAEHQIKLAEAKAKAEEEAAAKAKAAPPAPVASVPAPETQVQAKVVKPALSYAGETWQLRCWKGGVLSKDFRTEIKEMGDSILLIQHFKGGVCRFTGKKMDDNGTYEGIWCHEGGRNDGEGGKFHLQFKPDVRLAKGEETNGQGQSIRMELLKL